MAVFEGVVYHAVVIDPSRPCNPTLEVDAVLRPGDADLGPILLSVAEYMTMAGGSAAAGRCLQKLRRQGRIVDHLGVAHVAFTFWEPIDISGPTTPEG